MEKVHPILLSCRAGMASGILYSNCRKSILERLNDLPHFMKDSPVPELNALLSLMHEEFPSIRMHLGQSLLGTGSSLVRSPKKHERCLEGSCH